MQTIFQTQMWSTKHTIDEALVLLIFCKCILHGLSYLPPTIGLMAFDGQKCFLMACNVLQIESHYWCTFVYNVHIWHLMPFKEWYFRYSELREIVFVHNKSTRICWCEYTKIIVIPLVIKTRFVKGKMNEKKNAHTTFSSWK